MLHRTKVQSVACFGILVAIYAYHVESKLEDPFYEPACSGMFGGNCGTVSALVCPARLACSVPAVRPQVFKSEYAHILSACGCTYLRSAGKEYDLAEMGLCLLPKKFAMKSVEVMKEAQLETTCSQDPCNPDCWKFKNEHPLDLSLAVQGMLLYTAYLVAISIKTPFPFRELLFLGVAICDPRPAQAF